MPKDETKISHDQLHDHHLSWLLTLAPLLISKFALFTSISSSNLFEQHSAIKQENISKKLKINCMTRCNTFMRISVSTFV